MDDGRCVDLQAGAPHAGAHSFDDQATFEFRDGPDDNYDGPAQGVGGVDIFAEADVLDLETVELVQDFKEVFDRPGDPVGGPDQDNFELAAAGIDHHLIEPRPFGLPHQHLLFICQATHPRLAPGDPKQKGIIFV